MIRRGASRIVEVSEDAAREAMALTYRTTHNLPEPAGSLALAGLLGERDRVAGRRVAVVMTGIAAKGYPLWIVRTGLELTALVAGWALGGDVGIGRIRHAGVGENLRHKGGRVLGGAQAADVGHGFRPGRQRLFFRSSWRL